MTVCISARTVFEVPLHERQSVSLNELLGAGGQRLVETLESLHAGENEFVRAAVGLGESVPATLDWRRTRAGPLDKRTYELRLAGAALGEELRGSGVSQVSVALTIGNQVADLKLRGRYRTTSVAEAPPAVHDALAAAGVQTLNHLLALTIVPSLVQRMRERIAVGAERRMEQRIRRQPHQQLVFQVRGQCLRAGR